jgi:prepilin-type N-terminal cleavage/methylation domain-containing protein
MKMKTLHKGQKGLTILELIVGIAVIGIISAAVTMAIFQTFTGSTRNSNHMIVVRQVQEAGYWVSFYTYASQNMTITGDAGFPLILRWVDFEYGYNHEVKFSLNNSGLRGTYSVDNVTDPVKTGKIPVFSSINPDKTKTNCQVSGGSAFSLPDIGDAFNITGGNVSDNGRISVVAGGTISVSTAGNATCVPVTGGYTWTTTATGDTITVTAASFGTKGSWTSETKAATAGLSVDVDKDTTLSSARGLIFTVTATVGTGAQIAEETRIYKVVPKPVS